eukprot:7603804-Pyramimonas_sp.AAC.1
MMNGTICLTGPGCQSGSIIVISRRERRHRLEIMTERGGGLARLVAWTYSREDRRLQTAASGAAKAREFVESVGGPQLSAAR